MNYNFIYDYEITTYNKAMATAPMAAPIGATKLAPLPFEDEDSDPVELEEPEPEPEALEEEPEPEPEPEALEEEPDSLAPVVALELSPSSSVAEAAPEAVFGTSSESVIDCLANEKDWVALTEAMDFS